MSAEAVFQVEGMTCGACTASITKNLKQLPGVSDVTVSLLTEEAKVIYDPTLQTPQDFVEAIEDSGFGATEIRSSEVPYVTVIQISGMTCGACSASLTEALSALPGVESVSISLVTETGRIIHSPRVKTEQIITAVEDCGFDAVIESSKPAKSELRSDQNSSYTTTVSISGMTCGSCVASVTEALKSNPHITNAVVSLITEEGSIQHSGEITGPEIVEIIENAGFDAALISSLSDSAPAAIEEDEEVKLSIHGITPETDLSNLQYNIEAYLTSTPGVVSYELSLLDGEADENEDPELQQAHELSVTFNPHLLGIRQLVDGLAAINSDLYFTILNSVDQSSAFQLKVLSRIKEIQYWKSNFTKSLIFGIPVLVLSNTQELSIWRDLTIFPGFYWVSLLQLVITVHVYFNLCKIFNKKFVSFVKNKGKNATMDVLVCISTSVSFIFSILSIALSVWSGQTEKPPKLLFDTVCMLVGFISFGKWLENRAKGGTSTALSKLLSLTPTNCTIISDTTRYEEFLESQKSAKSESMIDLPSRTVGIDLIQTDDIAIVLPGGKVPADGTIVYGESEIDESLITGESLPIFKKKGDKVIGGSINGPGLIHIKVVTSGKKSQLQQIINLVRESQINKAPSQGFADYVAARFVPGVIFLSTLTFTFWTIVCWVNHPDSLPMVFRKDDNGKFFVCLKLAISVVVVACPCALGLAAPTAIMVGTGVGASHGVLIKGGDILEKASSINVILFDKTGTLTTGNMKTNKYNMEEKLGLSQADWWTLIGSVEASSEHPIGRAIVKASKEYLGLTFEEDTFNTRISEFKAHAGLGVEAVVQLENGQSHEISIGNERMIKQMYSDLYEKSSQLNLKDERANTVAYIIIDNQFCGYIELEDEIKPNAKEVLDYIRYVEGYQVGIVTGDNHKAASKIGKALGIPDCNVFSEVTPVNKDKVIVELKERLGGDKNVGIAFIGDGINDAPALVQADIGMAMSSGTDVAIESADVVLIGNSGSKSDLVGVLNALKISNATFARIKLNFIWAAIYNLIMLPFAMGCFLPINLMLPPIFAGAAMAFSSVSVVINSLMLKRYQGPSIEKSSIRYDLEQELGEFDQFSLKTGSLIEFNQIKRNRNARHSIKAALKRIWRGRRSGGNYELLSS